MPATQCLQDHLPSITEIVLVNHWPESLVAVWKAGYVQSKKAAG